MCAQELVSLSDSVCDCPQPWESPSLIPADSDSEADTAPPYPLETLPMMGIANPAEMEMAPRRRDAKLLATRAMSIRLLVIVRRGTWSVVICRIKFSRSFARPRNRISFCSIARSSAVSSGSAPSIDIVRRFMRGSGCPRMTSGLRAVARKLTYQLMICMDGVRICDCGKPAIVPCTPRSCSNARSAAACSVGPLETAPYNCTIPM